MVNYLVVRRDCNLAEWTERKTESLKAGEMVAYWDSWMVDKKVLQKVDSRGF